MIYLLIYFLFVSKISYAEENTRKDNQLKYYECSSDFPEGENYGICYIQKELPYPDCIEITEEQCDDL